MSGFSWRPFSYSCSDKLHVRVLHLCSGGAGQRLFSGTSYFSLASFPGSCPCGLGNPQNHGWPAGQSLTNGGGKLTEKCISFLSFRSIALRCIPRSFSESHSETRVYQMQWWPTKQHILYWSLLLPSSTPSAPHFCSRGAFSLPAPCGQGWSQVRFGREPDYNKVSNLHRLSYLMLFSATEIVCIFLSDPSHRHTILVI